MHLGLLSGGERGERGRDFVVVIVCPSSAGKKRHIFDIRIGSDGAPSHKGNGSASFGWRSHRSIALRLCVVVRFCKALFSIPSSEAKRARGRLVVNVEKSWERACTFEGEQRQKKGLELVLYRQLLDHIYTYCFHPLRFFYALFPLSVIGVLRATVLVGLVFYQSVGVLRGPRIAQKERDQEGDVCI